MAITKVTNSLVATNAIQGTLIADNAITSVHIAQNQVTAVQIPDGSITSTQIAANSIDTAELVTGSIDTIHIGNDQVTTAKIADLNVTTGKIANNAITSAKIPDGSITATQLDSSTAPTFGNITTTGSLRGPASFTIDPAAVGDNTGTVVIAGSLQVDGTTTTINSTTLTVDDKLVTLASGSVNAAAADGAGIDIDISGVTNPSLRYDGTNDEWSFNRDVNVDGSLGVGVNNPTQLIDISGAGNSAFVKVGNNNGSILYGVNAAGNAFVSGQTSSKDLIFEVNNDEKMRIHNSGKLGIGTDTTTPTGKLTIANPTAYAPNTITAANTYIQLGSTDYGSGGSSSNDGKFMIGFGYTDGATNTHSPAYIGFEETSTSGDTKGELTFYTRDVITDTAPTERMRITDGGNVGIGTASPGRALEVSTDGTAQFRLSRVDSTINGNNTLGTIEFLGTDDTSGTIGATIVAHAASTWGGGAYPTDLRFSTMDGSTLSEQMRITRLGDVSIGSDHGGFSGWKVLNIRQNSTGGMLNFEEDDGTRAFTFANEGVGMRYQAHITGGYHRFETHALGAGTAMMILDNGNVGIGTASPGSQLEVRTDTSSSGYGSYPAITIRNDNAAGYGAIHFNEGSTQRARIEVGNNSGSPYLLMNTGTSTGNGIYIDSAGEVGIGETNPITKLHVKGTNNSAGDLWTAVGAGNVPSITIQNAGTTDNNNAALFFRNDSGMFASIGARFVNHTTDETELRFSATDTNGTTRERVTFKGTGGVGFGTSNPFSYGGQNFEFKDTSSNQTGVRVTSAASSFEVGTDANGGYLQAITPGDGISFYSANSSAADIQAMKINSTGIVTTPYNPAFRAYLSTEQTSTGEVTSGYTDNDTTASRAYDRTGHFNISNGRFTAPVDGVYVFSIMWDSLNSLAGFNLLVNGSNYNVMWEPTGFSNAAWESKYYGTHVKLSTNDYVTLYIAHASGTNPVHQGSGVWGHFAGALIG